VFSALLIRMLSMFRSRWQARITEYATKIQPVEFG
jgi:hypothetical protein